MFVPALFGVLVASQFISCVGIWYYKQWGVQLYLVTFFSKTLFFLITAQTGISFYFGLVISLASIVLLIIHYPKMNPNL